MAAIAAPVTPAEDALLTSFRSFIVDRCHDVTEAQIMKAFENETSAPGGRESLAANLEAPSFRSAWQHSVKADGKVSAEHYVVSFTGNMRELSLYFEGEVYGFFKKTEQVANYIVYYNDQQPLQGTLATVMYNHGDALCIDIKVNQGSSDVLACIKQKNSAIGISGKARGEIRFSAAK